jgi:hypothetical protein
MTDWLDDVLDNDPALDAPEGFCESVMNAVNEQRATTASSRRSAILSVVSGYAIAASLMLALGIWIGQGSLPLTAPVTLQNDAEMAVADIDSIYANRELLEMLEILEDDETTTLETVDFALDIIEPDEQQ